MNNMDDNEIKMATIKKVYKELTGKSYRIFVEKVNHLVKDIKDKDTLQYLLLLRHMHNIAYDPEFYGTRYNKQELEDIKYFTTMNYVDVSIAKEYAKIHRENFNDATKINRKGRHGNNIKQSNVPVKYATKISNIKRSARMEYFKKELNKLILSMTNEQIYNHHIFVECTTQGEYRKKAKG